MKVGEGKFIYRPVLDELNKEYYEVFFKWIYFRRNTIVLIDELMSFTTPTYCPEYLKGIYTRGRELNVTAWACTQRPKNIPLICMSEATHFFIFRLNIEDDRKRLVEVAGCKEFMELLPKHVYWYYNINLDYPIKSKLVLK
jgi:hypothetical protein